MAENLGQSFQSIVRKAAGGRITVRYTGKDIPFAVGCRAAQLFNSIQNDTRFVNQNQVGGISQLCDQTGWHCSPKRFQATSSISQCDQGALEKPWMRAPERCLRITWQKRSGRAGFPARRLSGGDVLFADAC